ncbi:unnamed protein product [Prunus armeniaca]|uniref:Uncharacterized protein n=1 Tax=Prunus armeniaca TaxID=36596 RepID=A0A6J5VSU2_PRUAR|nr:unnamed protein product [Prunus armeniaca]
MHQGGADAAATYGFGAKAYGKLNSPVKSRILHKLPNVHMAPPEIRNYKKQLYINWQTKNSGIVEEMG